MQSFLSTRCIPEKLITPLHVFTHMFVCLRLRVCG